MGRRGLRRQYDRDVLERLALIALGRSAGFSLDEIARMFAPDGRLQIDRPDARDKADELDLTIRKLTAMRDGLRHAAACRAPSHMECPTFRRLLKVAADRREEAPWLSLRTAGSSSALGGLMGCVALGAMFSLAVFLAPMSADTGWSRAGISFAMTINFLVMAFGSFGWGAASDRWGARVVTLIGAVLLGLALVLASRATTLLQLPAHLRHPRRPRRPARSSRR